MELTYTIELNDECAKSLQCYRCGRMFNVGDLITEIPLCGDYEVFCLPCAKVVREDPLL